MAIKALTWDEYLAERPKGSNVQRLQRWQAELAAELWVKHLGQWDNGDALQTAMHRGIQSQAPMPAIGPLRAAIVKLVMGALRYEPSKHRPRPDYGEVTDLAVDYGPGPVLRRACELAGCSDIQLPVKSRTSFYAPDAVSWRFGYRAQADHAYRVDGFLLFSRCSIHDESLRRWLVGCRVAGVDFGDLGGPPVMVKPLPTGGPH